MHVPGPGRAPVGNDLGRDRERQRSSGRPERPALFARTGQSSWCSSRAGTFFGSGALIQVQRRGEHGPTACPLSDGSLVYSK